MPKSSIGFTLIELLVVIGIIGLIVALVIPNLKQIRDEQNLKLATSEMVSNIRVAQNNATSGFKCLSNDTPPTNWHIKINNSQTYTIEPSCTDGSFLPAKIINLADFGVQISNISGCSSFNNSTLEFSNITGRIGVNLTGGCSNADPLVISLQIVSNNSLSRSINIDSNGRVYE